MYTHNSPRIHPDHAQMESFIPEVRLSIVFASYILDCSFFFFFNDPAPPKFYPLPLHDALPISTQRRHRSPRPSGPERTPNRPAETAPPAVASAQPSGSARAPPSWRTRPAGRQGPGMPQIGRAHV